MVDTKQLRIGNILSRDGKWHEVTGVMSNIIFSRVYMKSAGGPDLYEMADSFEPIPLTRELVRLSGFMHRESCFDSCFYHLGDVMLNGDFTISGQEMQAVKYLHQLQNIYYFLTGLELEIKQPLKR